MRIVGLENRMTALESGLKANTDVTNQIKSDTSDIVALLKGSKVVVGIIKWVGYVAAAGTAIYIAWHQLMHGGDLPPGAGK